MYNNKKQPQKRKQIQIQDVSEKEDSDDERCSPFLCQKVPARKTQHNESTAQQWIFCEDCKKWLLFGCVESMKLPLGIIPVASKKGS